MEDRRKGDRRQLYGKPFLAMLIGGLPEDRRKGDRRSMPETTATTERMIGTVRDEVSGAGELDAAT